VSALHLRAFLERLDGCAEPPSVVAGFDAFVDEILHVVQHRSSPEHYEPVPGLADMGALFQAAAGRSACRELVHLRSEPGGCAVNLGDGLQALGLPLDYFGCLGEPLPDCYRDFAAACRVCQVWGRESGRTLAFEFADGKYLLPSMRPFLDFTPDFLHQRLADGRYLAACRQAAVIVLTGWSLFPYMTDCWRVLEHDVFSHVSHRPWCGIDLIDPGGRNAADLQAMLVQMTRFEQHLRVAFYGNLNEVNRLSQVLDLPTVPDEDNLDAMMQQASQLRAALDISAVVTHARGCAVAADSAGTTACTGVICPRPRKSTGAGDRLNAGVSAGLALGAPWAECLAAGTACSGVFVRQARSARRQDLADFATAWAAGTLDVA
jgi:sugar/nucleoside kinase (ribokinase family)